MSQAYNIEWIRNIRIQAAASSWLSKKLITAEQHDAVKTAFPEQFYNPGIFVKIGLFVFASVACSFFSGFLSLFILGASNGDEGVSAISIISAIAFVVMLEFLIKDRKLFHSGVDNALLYAGIGAAMVPFFLWLDNPPVWLSCCYALLLLSVAFLRYADMAVTVATFVVLVVLLANLMMKLPLGAALLPFAIMALSAFIYYINQRIQSDYYEQSQLVISALCLITFYLGGNYYIVREGNAMLNNLGSVAPQIPFAPLFYSFTLVIPVCYVYFGLKSKNRALFITGLAAIAFSLFTYKYYFGILTPEQGLTVCGALMILIPVLLIRYLKTSKHGLSDEKEGDRKPGNLTALIAAQQLGQIPADKGVSFGGGNFGGGGAGNDY